MGMSRFVASIIRHNVLANVVLVGLIFIGYVSTTNLVREFFPEVSVDVIMITVIQPGADPQETEEGISRKMEEAIEGLEGIKKYTTVSSEGFSRSLIEVREGYDVAEVKDRVKNAIDSIPNLPEDAEKPLIEELTIEQEVLRIALWGAMDERTRKEWLETIRDEILELPSVSRVDQRGIREYEVGIEVSESRLREYNLSFEQVAAAVSRSNLNLAGGTIRTRGEEIRIRTIGRKYTAREIADIIVLATPEGDIITLDRIAAIRDEFVEDPVTASFNGEPASLLLVKNLSGEDAIQIAGEVRDYVAQREKTLPPGVNLTVWNDFSVLIEQRIALLLKNGLYGLCLVILLLWLFLDFRLSFWVSMGIPISFAGAFGLMLVFGVTVNMISLLGLLLVLGIIVDDAIVVGEAIYVHRKNGDPPMLAAVNGVKEVGLPVIAAVTTSIIAFLPLMAVPGVLGKIIFQLPIVVISALVISIVECLFILPAHLNHLPDLYEEAHKGRSGIALIRRARWAVSNGLERFIEGVYAPFVSSAVKWRYITFSVAIFVVLFTMGLASGGFIKFELFPNVDGNEVNANIEFPAGTPYAVTERAVEKTVAAIKRLDEKLETTSGKPMIRNIYAVVGEQGGDDAGSSPRGGGPNFGFIQVELLDTEERGIYFEDINAMWEQEVGPLPGVLSQSFSGEQVGPPGAPINIALRGRDLDQLINAAQEVKAELRSYDGVYQVDDNFRLGKNELQLQLKPEARTMGLTVQDLARQVYAGYFGQEAVRLQRGRDDVRVRVRYTENERSQFQNLDEVRIRTPRGDEVPLFSVADVHYTKGPSTITRGDGLRQVNVTAEVNARRANTEEVLADMGEEFLPALLQNYPGMSYRYEGPQQDSREAFSGLAIGFPMALLGIFVIISTIFRSYAQPFIILVTVPFGILGAIYGHMLLGYNVTMLSVFGMVALSGVVVNDAIVLIERVNTNIAQGIPFHEAVRRGGARRFRAIFLTTASTCGGLAPLISERSMQAQFLIPMALSLASGVFFATVLTLVLIPALLGILNDLRRINHFAFTRTWPTPDEVEPARHRLVDVLEHPASDPASDTAPPDPDSALPAK
jgi:multidrug efflux pump subunit AcrB